MTKIAGLVLGSLLLLGKPKEVEVHLTHTADKPEIISQEPALDKCQLENRIVKHDCNVQRLYMSNPLPYYVEVTVMCDPQYTMPIVKMDPQADTILIVYSPKQHEELFCTIRDWRKYKEVKDSE